MYYVVGKREITNPSGGCSAQEHFLSTKQRRSLSKGLAQLSKVNEVKPSSTRHESMKPKQAVQHELQYLYGSLR